MSKQKPVFNHLVMSIEEKRKLLDSAKGKFFSIDVIKLNGEVRHMVCKKWEEKAFTYGSKNARPNTCKDRPNIYTVCDVNLHEFRNIDLTRLVRVRIGGKEYGFTC